MGNLDVNPMKAPFGQYWEAAPTSGGTNNSVAFSSANRYYIVEMHIPEVILAVGGRYCQGATSSGNVLVAVYSWDGTSLLCSSPSTTQTGSTASQHAVPFTTPTIIQPGCYWMFLMGSSATGTWSGGYSMACATLVGGASFACPSTITPVTTLSGGLVAVPTMGVYT